MHDDETPRHRDPEVLSDLYEKHDGNKRAVADELGVAPSTVSDWLEYHGIAERQTRMHELLEEATPDAIGDDPSQPEGSA